MLGGVGPEGGEGFPKEGEGLCLGISEDGREQGLLPLESGHCQPLQGRLMVARGC